MRPVYERLRQVMFITALAVTVSACGSGVESNHDATERAPAQAAPIEASPEALAVFSRPAKESDSLPPSVLGDASSLNGTPDIEESLRPGRPDLGKVRLVLSGVGQGDLSLYAFPTDKGQACFLVPDGGATCVQEFTQSQPVGLIIFDRDALDAGEPTVVAGLVPDNVTGVEVLVGGVRHLAVLANNGYLHELDAGAWPQAIIVGYKDGTTRTMQVRGGPPK
jgi:hypothetical protein